MSFVALISKYFVSSSKSSRLSCYARPVSKGLSGILNEFIPSDFPKVETRISLVLLVPAVPSFGGLYDVGCA